MSNERLGIVTSGAEFFATCELLKIKLIITDCDDEGRVIEGISYGTSYDRVVSLVRADNYFMTYLEELDAIDN